MLMHAVLLKSNNHNFLYYFFLKENITNCLCILYASYFAIKKISSNRKSEGIYSCSYPTNIFSTISFECDTDPWLFFPKIKNQKNTLFEFEHCRLATSAPFTYASKVRHKGTLFDDFYEGFAHRTKKNSLFRTDARNEERGNKAPETLFFSPSPSCEEAVVPSAQETTYDAQ